MNTIESAQNSICLVYVYLGKFPWYFDFFINSCEDNESVDFIIFTDNDISKYQQINNVIFKSITLDDINKMFTHKLGFDIHIKKAYKLCDFKPAYGFLFQEYISDYQFWGVGDLDVIFGNIRDALTSEVLENHDVIFVRDDYPTGFFMLYRNTEYTRSLFMRSKDYKKIFTSDRHYCFDECNFQHVKLMHGQSIFDCPTEIDSFMHVIKREQSTNGLKVLFDILAVEGIPGGLTHTHDFLAFNRKYSIILYHLISLKQNILFMPPKWDKIPDIYHIGRYTFYKNTFFDTIKQFFIENIHSHVLLFFRRIRVKFTKKNISCKILNNKHINGIYQ